MATILERVSGLISRLSPAPICDDCITQRLSLSVRQRAQHTTRELAGIAGFERRKDVCSICGTSKVVIRRKSN